MASGVDSYYTSPRNTIVVLSMISTLAVALGLIVACALSQGCIHQWAQATSLDLAFYFAPGCVLVGGCIIAFVVAYLLGKH